MRVAALVGPTAVGKTSASLDLAERVGAEIVSIDSMQIYRGMDIGTAKPSPSELSRAPHHLLDLFEPSRDVSVAEFQSLARAAIEDVSGRGRLPLLVGGSGLYFRAVVDDLEFPPREAAVRRALEEEADNLGSEALHSRLQGLDPKAAALMEPTNTRRIVRALEVIEITGRPFSDNDTWERFESRYDLTVAGLTLSRDRLFERISRRVDEMLDRGLADEARSLSESGMSRTARQALGYRQILDAAAGVEPEKLREEIVRATKRFARRQESWFKADPRIRWFDAAEPDLLGALTGFFDRDGSAS
jgi:tRNA dimethylallyltransferase